MMPITIVSDEEAEKSDYLVCIRADMPSPFKDNLTGFCCKCGAKVQFRWHAPRKPKRICFLCVTEEAKNSEPPAGARR
jgi:hypothetical protein